MRPAEKKQVVQAIRTLVPELHAKGRLLAATPRGRILRGVYLEPSSSRGRFYVWIFVQPLYVPSDTIVFSVGDRLGRPQMMWSADDAEAVAVAVRDEGRPFFGHVSSPEALAEWTFLQGRGWYSQQARAFSLVASGRYAEGAKALRELADSFVDDDRAWVLETRQRAMRLADLAERSPDEAQALLRKWEEETVAVLKLQDIP